MPLTSLKLKGSALAAASEPPTAAALPFIFGPSLLPALALEHPHRAATAGIKHFLNEFGLLATTTAPWDWIGLVAGKYFILKFVVHQFPRPTIGED
jgi:hypothetical protein